MARTYEDFKTFLTTFLWKASDTVLIANLDSMIQMANNELTRTLKIQDREITAIISADGEEVDLPSDYHSMRDVASPNQVGNGGEWHYVTPARIVEVRAHSGSQQYMPVYSLRHKTLLLAGPFSATDPYDLSVTYQAKLPDYATTDQSWVEEDYLDLYAYTVLKHAAMFVREDERLAAWQGLADTALTQILEDDAHDRARGNMDAMQMPRAASSPRGRGYYSR